MERSDDAAETSEQSAADYRMPAMPRVSPEPGRVERFVTNLLRRRGTYQHIVRRKSR